MSIGRFERLDAYGDTYEALDVCQTLEMVISRLRQQRLFDDQEWSKTSASIAEIRERLQGHLTEP
ncbi:MAG TPA: hypothetical protein VF221_01230 [Chloroflexota bacterium]